MSHIIWLFARLYITLLMVTAALSFPLVYLVLQLWKQIYTVFFNCGFWFWTGIFISVAMITALTIWFRILKIAELIRWSLSKMNRKTIFELENKRKQNDTALFKSCFAQFDEI